MLAALAERLTNAEIAARLYVSERTVESHVAALLRKLGAANRLELAAAAKSAAAGAPLPTTLSLLADPTSYVGRARERAALEDLWTRAGKGEFVVGVVTGEAGIGKSRLVAEMAAAAHAKGGRVLYGACTEDAAVPYEPFRQALGPGIAGVSGVADIDSAQAGVAVSVGDALARTSAGGAVLCVIEDAHWATATSIGAIRHLARAGPAAPVLLLITSRRTPPDVDDAVEMLLGDLARLPNVAFVELRGLPPDDVARLLASLGTIADVAVAVSDTGGNPLLVREYAAHDGAGGVALAGLLTRRYRLLSDDDLAVLDVAATIGADFEIDVMSRALGRDADGVVDALDRIEAAGLITAGGRRFAFVHALFRRARYDAIAAARRAVLHRDIALALEDLARDDARLRPELARHACAAVPLFEASRAVDHAVAAAELAEQSLALDEAAVHYRRALEIADPDRTLDLSIRLGEVLHGTSDPAAEDILRRAGAQARAAGEPAALASVALAMVRYVGRIGPGEDVDFIDIAEEALGTMDAAASPVRARTMAALAEELAYTDMTRAFDLASGARSMAEKLGDPMTLGHVLLSYRFAARAPENAAGLATAAAELVAIGRATGHAPFVLLGLLQEAWNLRGAGELADADRACAAAAEVLGAQPAPIYEALFMCYRSCQRLMAGDIAGAEEAAADILGLSGRGFDPTIWFGPVLMTLRAAQDRLGELIPLIEPGIDQLGLGRIYRSALAVAYAFDGRTADASRELGWFRERGLETVPRNMLWFSTMACLAEAGEVVGDVETCAAVGAELNPFSGRIAEVLSSVTSSVDFALAQCALIAGDRAAAARYAEAAVAASRTRGTDLFLGRELLRLAAARAPESDVTPLVAEAFAIADRTGAVVIRRDAERLGLRR